MEPVVYVYEAFGNRDLPEEKQGFAKITLLSAADQSHLTNHLIAQSLKGGKKIKVDFAQKSLAINRKHCPKIFNVLDPMTEDVIDEMTIDDAYNLPQFKELYEELSNAVGEFDQLKEGIKKK